jgi:hypothetical protein
MKKLILFICFALAGQAAFAQATEPKKKKKKKAKTETETSNQAGGRQMATTLLTVHFISKGAGIDQSAYDQLVTFANNHPKNPAFTEDQQGREGEKKVSFTLAELTPAEQTAFMQEVQKMLGSNDRVIIDSKLKTKKSITTKEETVVTKDEAPAVGQLGGPKPVKTRLVLSFISKGAGIDGKDLEKIRDYVENHPKKPAYEVKTWGREGEKDYLFTLKELTPDEQKVFVDDIKKLVSSPDMVFIRENENYVKKGR